MTAMRTIMLAVLVVVCTSGTALAKKMPDIFVAKDGVRMVLIPRGTFLMGSNDMDLGMSQPVHKVSIGSFYMDEHTVTNGQFVKFLNAMKLDESEAGVRRKWVVLRTDIYDIGRKSWWPTEIGFERGKYVAYGGFEGYPVVSVSWEAAARYCKWAGKRLPTEAEWEKAARGKLNQEKYPWGSSLPTVGIIFNREWFDNQAPPPFGQAKSGMPNGYGLYNMAGLVWEWCTDWFQPDYYMDSPKRDPQGPESGRLKVMRGGSWFNPANHLRTALRNFMVPTALDESSGFRCVADNPTPENTDQGDIAGGNDEN